MWIIDDFEIRDVQLDFTSSDGGRPWVRSIYSSEICLVNALEYTHFDEDPTQLLVCEQCGNTGCAAGGWVQIRRIADYVGLIPALHVIGSDPERFSEFSPPAYLDSSGFLFTRSTYELLCQETNVFPPFERVKSLSAGEAVRLLQWQAPMQVLGCFPDRPVLVQNSILAVSDGQLEDQCDLFRQFLDVNFDSPVSLEGTEAHDAISIEFYLDGPGFPTWNPLARIGNQLAFNFEPKIQLISTDQSSSR